jgi:hypothetical protein
LAGGSAGLQPIDHTVAAISMAIETKERMVMATHASLAAKKCSWMRRRCPANLTQHSR